jgi:outer membrane receptor protein involved in Fe transport
VPKHPNSGYDQLNLNDTEIGVARRSALTPKLAMAWKPINHVELYADYGDSFHSNTMRGWP